jgi:2-polyprenyl-6-hydroxyphenyl methylase/3-demethylubiquinone-9 3-methyltransferase
MTSSTKTDRQISINAKEFVWDTEGLSELHSYVGPSILKLLKEHNVKNVLDLGCGNGAFTARMGEDGYNVLGTEYSESGIEIAKKNHPGISFVHYDVSDPLPSQFVGKYDAVTSIEVIEHLLLPRRLVEHGLLALKPGGVLILTTPFHGYLKNLALAVTNKFDDHWHPLRDFGHVKFFSKATLTQLMGECGASDVKIVNVGRIPAFAKSMIACGTKS